jgi:hypothetical protein
MAMVKRKKQSKNAEVKTVDPLNPADFIEVFDSLPKSVQRNHNLLKGFCKWYSGYYKRENIQTRIQAKGKAKELKKQYPKMSGRKISEHPEMLEIAGMYASKTRYNWVRAAIYPKGRN